MGVPHLITTLEPYAEHRVLQDEDVVIDGPALAYHILHICRANGVHQPSYRLLGLAVLKWLDELQYHRLNIQRIYFDGHLPPSKLSVRMERMVKNNSRLDDFFSSHPKGLGCLPLNHPMENVDFDAFQLSANHSRSRPFPDPSFLVPAVIDAIRNSPSYHPILSIVPGEADAFCAKHVARHGGVVMTSDSDLLVHDLGQGKVVFLREIHRNANKGLSCSTFHPGDIYRKLGLSDSTEPWRFAYERRCSPNATLSRLVKTCTLPVVDAVDYEEFRQQYLHEESADLPLTREHTPLSLLNLDPRLSELLLQLGLLGRDPNASQLEAKVFLPTMMDSPLEGTAWEPSTPIRQLAYTIAGWMFRCPSSVQFYEYRRVKQRHQKGRQVNLMAQDLSDAATNRLHLLVSQAKDTLTASMSGYYWIYVCLALNMMECEEQGKHSHVLKMLRNDHRASSRLRGERGELPWDLVHFVANVQAGLYSLRMLGQVLSLMTDRCAEEEAKSLAANLPLVRHSLTAGFPSLLELPDTTEILNFLELARQDHALKSLERLTNAGTWSETKQTTTETQKTSKLMGQGKKDNQTSGTWPALLGNPPPNNMFALLDADDDT